MTNVTYINRNYITMVNRNAFVSGTTRRARVGAMTGDGGEPGRFGARSPRVPFRLADRRLLRVAVTTDRVRSCVARTLPSSARSVVVRAAPPPAPPTFQAKLGVITRNQGAPSEAAAAARISVENRAGARRP